MAAAWTGQPELVKVLIQASAHVNQKDEDGETALLGSVRATPINKGTAGQIVNILLAAGADAKAKDRFGKTTSDSAYSGGHDELVQQLQTAEIK